MGQRGTLWEDILAQHCIALGALCAGKPADAYAQLNSYSTPFLKVRPPRSPQVLSCVLPEYHALALQ